MKNNYVEQQYNLTLLELAKNIAFQNPAIVKTSGLTKEILSIYTELKSTIEST